MSGFSRTEYAIARLLGKTPLLKKSAKYFWIQLNFFFNRPTTRKKCLFPVKRLSSPSIPGFFGYYDLSPSNASGTHAVFHEMKNGRLKGDVAEIIIIDLASNDRRVVGDTRMFNLQSGSRLQWLNDREVIYNKEAENGSHCGTVRYDIVSGKSRFYDFPVFLADESAAYAINLQALLAAGNEYAYRALKNSKADESMLSRMDWQSGQIRTLMTNSRLVGFGNTRFPKDSVHTVNHLMLSPDRKKLLFIHRWYTSRGKAERLLLYDVHTDMLTLLNDEMTSHCCWMDDTTVLGYMRHEGVDGYYLLSTKGIFKKWEAVSTSNVSDGHPSHCKKAIVFDTYPDKSRMQSLYLATEEGTEQIGRFFSPVSFDPYFRCDLHPRFDASGSRIFIDSDFDGTRGLYMIDLETR